VDELPTPTHTFAAVVAAFAAVEGVTYASATTQPKGKFGSATLKVHNKIFAMLVKEQFVVKLPKQRVAELCAAGLGQQFTNGNGQLMKEWLAVPVTAEVDWLTLANEAKTFVATER
jgi:TfoX/Sxy family transcriptional regulator of competence genes